MAPDRAAVIVAAYYPGWVQRSLPPDRLPWDAITHVVHFGRYPTAVGTLPVADLQSEGYHAPLVAAARAHGRTPLLCGGGGGSFQGQEIGANFAAACSTPAGRARLVGNIVTTAERYGYDGVDLDWEESVPANADAYVALLAELRSALGPRRLLTAAVVSGMIPGRIAARARASVDLWNLMAYWSDGRDQLGHYVAAGIPAAKCVVGAGFSNDPDFYDHASANVRTKVAAARAGGAAGVMFWQAGDLTPSSTTDPRLQPLREAMVPVTYPGGSYRPLGAQTQPRMSSHQVVCIHTMVGYLSSTDAYFRTQGFGGTESHFGVGGKWGGDAAQGLDGKVWQWQDLDHTADANLEGNDRVISIETADNAPQSPDDIEAWTPAQVDAIVALVAWLCRTYDIPPRLIPDTKPGTRGIGYHAQGTAANLPAGAERWSTTTGKPCPTARRIAQITGTVIPRVQVMLDQEADVPLTDEEIDKIAAKVWGFGMADGTGDVAKRAAQVYLTAASNRALAAQKQTAGVQAADSSQNGALTVLQAQATALSARVTELGTTLAKLTEAMANMPTSQDGPALAGDLTVTGIIHVAPPAPGDLP